MTVGHECLSGRWVGVGGSLRVEPTGGGAKAPHPTYSIQDRAAETPPYLLMYSPVRTFPQDLHLKHPKCHCFSSASSACPFLMSLPQPAQSGRERQPAVTAFVLLTPSFEASSEPQCAPSHSINIYLSTISFCFLSL